MKRTLVYDELPRGKFIASYDCECCGNDLATLNIKIIDAKKYCARCYNRRCHFCEYMGYTFRVLTLNTDRLYICMDCWRYA